MTPWREKWESGDACLYLGDSLLVLPELPDESVDIVWTDPPYGHNNNNNDLIHRREAALGLVKCVSQEDARPIFNDGYSEMRRVVDGALRECARILKRDCCCCCCCCCGGGPSPTFAWVANRMDEQGLTFFHAVVWDKGGLGMGWRYRRNYEMVMVAHRRGGKLKWETDDSGPKTANVVRIGKVIPRADEHQTLKPVELVSHFLDLHAKAGDIVLDPFMGAGTVGVAALAHGCRFIGIEIDDRWYEAAKARIKKAQNSAPLYTTAPKARQTVIGEEVLTVGEMKKTAGAHGARAMNPGRRHMEDNQWA